MKRRGPETETAKFHDWPYRFYSFYFLSFSIAISYLWPAMQEQVSNQLQHVFRMIFKDESLVISPGTSSKDIKMWDSLMHMELITAIESEFHITFSFNEVMQFNNAGDLSKLIEAKLKQ